MKKVSLILFILVDLVVIGASVLYLLGHLKTAAGPAALTSASSAAPVASSTASAASVSTAAAPAGQPSPAAGGTASGTTRKVLFTYRNSRARKVMIRAEFTGWRAEAMQKEPAGAWTYTAALEPGEYAYLFSVDDRPKLDPANKRTKRVGKTFVSAVVVQPLPAPSH